MLASLKSGDLGLTPRPEEPIEMQSENVTATPPDYRNWFRYDQTHSPFVDGYGHFSVGFASWGMMGLGQISPRGCLAIREVLDPGLVLSLREGPLVAVRTKDLECYPWSARQVGTHGDLQVSLAVSFVDETTVVAEFCFTSERTVEFRPVFQGRALPDELLSIIPFYHGSPYGARRLEVTAGTDGVEVRLLPEAGVCHLPQIAIRIRCADERFAARADDGVGGTLESGSPLYAFESANPLTVTPGQPVVLRFQLEVRMAAIHQALPSFHNAVDPTPLSDIQARRREWIADAIGESDNTHITRARLALVRNGLRGLNGEFNEDIASLCSSSSDDFSCSFFWDTLFSSVAIARFNLEYARGAIATAFTRHLERDGSTPERKSNFSLPERMFQQSPQSPVASWAVASYLKQHDDPAFLARMFPFLVRNHRFWEDYSDVDQDGLAEYRWTGQAADNSPLWDPYMQTLDAMTGCSWIPPVASVALNSFLYWDARHLAHLAHRAGQPDEAERMKARQAALHKAMHEVCYLPEERRYWDYNHHTQQHQRVRTFYMFWPLFAGMDVEEATARDLIENVLLDPNQFFGAIPFPSVAYDEPTYDGNGYWRGKSWPHISYWLLQTLWCYGYQREADAAADRMITVFTGTRGFLENMGSDRRRRDKAGFPDYNWGSAAAALTLERAYREPSPLD